MITDLPAKRVFKRYHSGKHFSEFYLQDGDKNQLWNKITPLSLYVYGKSTRRDSTSPDVVTFYFTTASHIGS